MAAITKYRPGKDIPFNVGTAVTARQIVVLTGDYTVGPAGASAPVVVGVATNDGAVGDKVTISSGGVQRVTASGAIAAGARVATGANGVAVASGTNSFGTALAAAVDGGIVDVRFDV